MKGRTMRSLALTGVALLMIGLAGCTAPAADNAPPAPSESATSGSDAGTADEPCGGLTTDDLAGIFGVTLQGPDPSTGDSDQNGVTWTSTGCDWEGEGELELDLDISQGSDFPDGKLVCIEPGGVGEVTPVDGIGTQAWWKFDDLNEVEGELRVCTDDRLIEFAVDAETGSMTGDELRDKAVSAVRLIVG